MLNFFLFFIGGEINNPSELNEWQELIDTFAPEKKNNQAIKKKIKRIYFGCIPMLF